ncbi:MAG: alpha/beta hydrolase [Ectothiorhodospiraceae bacterium]|jgi:phospholipase/carboxylesterase|nr:alpha/beta hydrolase [Ectothiorhodospiraceae bacterium]
MNASELLPALRIETGAHPTAAVIWLHGLGADGHDFEPIVPEFDLPATTTVRFVFPHAPVRPVTVNAGMRMRAWYDFARMDLVGSETWEHISESVQQVRALMAEEVRLGIAPERVFLAGFSQGGVIALHAGLTHPEPIGGVIALSTYLPFAERVAPRQRPAVFLAHGQHDPVIPLAAAERARDWLKDAGCDLRWQVYPMQHSVCMPEIADIRSWLLRRLA